MIALAGNKADMESKRKVQTEEAQQYAQENEIIFMETSAKTSLNVRNLFVEIGTSILKRYMILLLYSQEAPQGPSNTRKRLISNCPT